MALYAWEKRQRREDRKNDYRSRHPLPEEINQQFRVSSGAITLPKSFATQHGDQIVQDAVELTRIMDSIERKFHSKDGDRIAQIFNQSNYGSLLCALPRSSYGQGLFLGDLVFGSMRSHAAALEAVNPAYHGRKFEGAVGQIGKTDYIPFEGYQHTVRDAFKGPGFHEIRDRVLAEQKKLGL